MLERTAPDVSWQRPLRAGAAISGDGEAFGTLGGIVTDRATGRPLLIGSQHVLGVRPETEVWQPTRCSQPGCDCNSVGRILRARRSIVRWHDDWYYVDAAIATIDEDIEWQPLPAVGTAPAAMGMRVHKVGAGTGATRGVILDERHRDQVRLGALDVQVPNQLLIQPLPEHPCFSSEGDSGALVRAEDERVVGILWGVNSAGLGVACAIGPVLDELNVSIPVQPQPTGHGRCPESEGA